MILKSSPIHIWNKNWGFIRVRFLEAAHGGQLIFGRFLTLINPPFSFHIWTEDGLGSSLRPNTPYFNSKMTELGTKYQLASGDSLQKNVTLMNPPFSLQIWIEDDFRSIFTQNNVGQLSKMAELDTGGCSWRPIDIWALAQSSLRVVLHCFRWKCSWRHPLSTFE